jgi:glutamate-1-semialdehyde 2,1-aminomutase
MTRSEELFREAVKFIPGGVNSPVRAFGSVGECPRFISRAEGPFLYDVDGKRYIDYIGSWGPMILGHNRPEIRSCVVEACQNGLSFGAATEMEVKMAKLICELVPSIEMVRMVNSGTEAVMSAIRAARGYTGRDKIIKFNGCYHGHSDGLLVKAGSGVMSGGVPDSLGVPRGCTSDTLTAEYNNICQVQDLFHQYGREIAAIIVEPVAANMGVVLPREGFLQGLRQLCDENGTILIFDEVITGFRLGLDGAAGYYGVSPDLTTYGKIIGAGMPVGAYGGRREIMEVVAPLGGVYQAGTLSGNPVAMAAGYTQLSILKENPEYYERLNQTGEWLFGEIDKRFKSAGKAYRMNNSGSLGSLFFTGEEVYDYPSAKKSDTEQYKAYFKYMLNEGIYLAPAQFEAMFISVAHGEEEIKQTLAAIDKFLECD